MNKIILRNIKITNFKGISFANVEFDDTVTQICGENGSGKTSIKNAFEWVLCQNVVDVLPMINNKEIPNLVTLVTCTLNINGYDYVIERQSQGKYSLNKETQKVNKVSNEATYRIDGMEMKEKDYKEKLANLLSNGVFENLQILTDKEYFNTDTTKFKWNDRRKILFDMCNINNLVKDIIKDERFSTIKDYILKGNATSDIKSMLGKKKKSYKEQQIKNNILIGQKQEENFELSKINFEQLELELKNAKSKYSKILSGSKKENQSEQINELQEQLLIATREKALLESSDTTEQENIRRFLRETYNETSNLRISFEIIQDKLSAETSKVLPLINDSATCPTCHRPLDIKEIELKNKEIEEKNNQYKTNIEKFSKEMEEIKVKYDEKKSQFKEQQDKLDTFKPNEKIEKYAQEIADIRKLIEEAKEKNLNKLSTEQQTTLEERISTIERQLANRELIEKNQLLINKWKDENKIIADNIVIVEQKETALATYVKEQTDLILDTVNSKFSNGVTWALYKETYKNGEGGIEEDCVCMYNGKRYSSLSMGEKNITNIEVVKTLQKYFGVNIPVFSDNAESITIKYDIDSQIIELFAEKGNKLDYVEKIIDKYKGE